MKPYLRKVCLLALMVVSYAQEPDQSVPEYRRPVLKFFPLPMVDPFQYTLHLGVEVPTSRQNSLQIEGGWVFGHLGEDLGTGTSAEDFSQTGFKARIQWREYFLSNKPPDHPIYTLTGGYIALIAGYQLYNQNLGYIDTTGWYSSPQPVMGGISYERRIQAFMGGFLTGLQSQVGSRLVFDLYAGLAVRYSTHQWSPIAPPSLHKFTPVGDFIMRRGGRPIPLMGFSMGWILR